MDWQSAADAFIRVWRETGIVEYGGVGVLVLLVFAVAWKALDAWGKRRGN